MSVGQPEQRSRAAEPPTRYTRRSATYIGSLTLTAKVAERLAAFGQIALIASIYGASTRSDLYFISSIIPLTLGTIVGEALATSSLPLLVQRQHEPDFRDVLRATFWSALGVLVAILALYLVVIGVVVRAAAPAGSASLQPWVAFSPTIVTLGLSAYFGSVLLLYERYAWPPFRAAAATIAALMLTALALAFTDDITWIALATSGGYLVSLLLLVADLGRSHGFAFLRLPTPAAFRRIAHLRSNVAVALSGGVLGGQSFVLLERALAASIGVGAVSTISYARGIVFTPNMIGQAISMGLYPGMVRAFEAKDVAFVRNALVRGLRLTLVASSVMVVFFALYGDSLVRTLLERGALDAHDAHAVAQALVAFAPAVVGTMLLILSSRVFYAIDYFRGIVWSQLAALVLYVPLAFALRNIWETNGLALAFGVAELAGGLLGILLAARLLELTASEARSLVAVARPIALVAGIVAVVRVAADPLPLTGDVHALALTAIGGVATVTAVTAYLLSSDWPEIAILRRYALGVVNLGKGLRVRS